MEKLAACTMPWGFRLRSAKKAPLLKLTELGAVNTNESATADLATLETQLSSAEGTAAHRHKAEKKAALAELVRARVAYCKDQMLKGEEHCRQLARPQVGMRVIELESGRYCGVVTKDEYDKADNTTFTVRQDEDLELEEVLVEPEEDARYFDRWLGSDDAEDDDALVAILEPPHLTELLLRTRSTYKAADERLRSERAELAELRASIVAACAPIHGLATARGWRPLATVAEELLTAGNYGRAIALLDAAIARGPSKRVRKKLEERLQLARQGPRCTAAAAARAAEARVATLLNKYDTDRSGSLELAEFRRLIKELRPARMGHGSPHPHGEVHPSSMATGSHPSSSSSKQQHKEEDIEATFRRFDADASGSIAVQELREALGALGIQVDVSGSTSERRGYLVALPEILGHADPKQWRSQFRELLLYSAEARGATPSAFDLNNTNKFLLEHYRDYDDDGENAQEIREMVHEGWAAADAEPVCLAFGYCGQGLGRAVRAGESNLTPPHPPHPTAPHLIPQDLTRPHKTPPDSIRPLRARMLLRPSSRSRMHTPGGRYELERATSLRAVTRSPMPSVAKR